MNPETQLLARAHAVIGRAVFGQLNTSSMAEYVAVARRLEAAKASCGPDWPGPVAGVANARTASVRRAAWTRAAHWHVADYLRRMNEGLVEDVDGLRELLSWVSEAEAWPPMPGHAPGPAGGRPAAVDKHAKRNALHELPSNWMGTLWQAAVDRGYVHLDGLAVLLVTGCRPAEACTGVGVRRVDGGVQVVIRGSKVGEHAGQPWRLLTVATGDGGPTDHLAALADADPAGKTKVKPSCSPNALSMGVTDIAADCLPGRRLSAYDLRHQRASDARATFGDDLESVAAWLGHSGLSTLRFYGRLPRRSGSRGPRPLAASAARPVVRKTPAQKLVQAA